jgi:hypothetical protein
MWARWDSTVRMEMKSCSAISALVCPRARSRRTPTSRSVRWSGGPVGPGDSAAIGAPDLWVGLAARGEADGLDELALDRVLQHVAEGPGAEGLAGERRVRLHGEDDDLRVRELLAEPGDRGEARLSGHVEVEDENPRAVAEHVAAGRGDVRGLRHDLEVRLHPEQAAEAAADERVVVGEDDLDRVGRRLDRRGRDVDVGLGGMIRSCGGRGRPPSVVGPEPPPGFLRRRRDGRRRAPAARRGERFARRRCPGARAYGEVHRLIRARRSIPAVSTI